jgi:phosphoglycerol transferase MdoB-like AlkP superfamily enzyme
MSKLSVLDWSLIVGVIAYGVILGVYFERQYKFPWYHFFLAAFFIASMAAILIATYQVIRPALALP